MLDRQLNGLLWGRCSRSFFFRLLLEALRVARIVRVDARPTAPLVMEDLVDRVRHREWRLTYF